MLPRNRQHFISEDRVKEKFAQKKEELDKLEESMNFKAKKIIAREGLILLGIIMVGCLVITTPGLYIKPRPIRIERIENKETPICLLGLSSGQLGR